MRTIKFKRAHFKDEGKTQFSHFSEWGVGLNHTSFTSPSHNNFAIYYEDLQFTGLKDSKRTKEFPDGQEIYEGDILKLSYETISMIGYVKQQKDGEWIFYKDEGNFLGVHHNIDKIKVIGNIHENSNLLEL